MTHRAEVESLANTLNAHGYVVSFTLDPNGYIDSVAITGGGEGTRTMDCLSFAEKYRPVCAMLTPSTPSNESEIHRKRFKAPVHGANDEAVARIAISKRTFS